MSTSNNDCYFYYYSTCTRGLACPYRHEPAALNNEATCKYWKAGSCTMPNCIYRHLDVTENKRKDTICYWEDKPGGCRKPHCPFKHKEPKLEPYPQELTEAINSAAEKPQKIIVNKSKISDLDSLILPVKPLEQNPKGSAKSRLGSALSVKDRLGGKVESIEVFQEDSDEEYEEPLRGGSGRTGDLRSRLGPKPSFMGREENQAPDNVHHFDDDESVDLEEELDVEELQRVRSVVKKVKKEKKKKDKKEKKEKRKKSEKHDRTSLADEIAAKREENFGKDTDASKENRKRKSGPIASPLKDEDEDMSSSKRSRKTEKAKRKPELEIYRPGEKKLKPKTQDQAKSDKRDKNWDDLEKFLKENPDVEAATNSTVDVMKELDDLLKEN